MRRQLRERDEPVPMGLSCIAFLSCFKPSADLPAVDCELGHPSSLAMLLWTPLPPLNKCTEQRPALISLPERRLVNYLGMYLFREW